jgi:hypothetical protein
VLFNCLSCPLYGFFFHPLKKRLFSLSLLPAPIYSPPHYCCCVRRLYKTGAICLFCPLHTSLRPFLAEASQCFSFFFRMEAVGKQVETKSSIIVALKHNEWCEPARGSFSPLVPWHRTQLRYASVVFFLMRCCVASKIQVRVKRFVPEEGAESAIGGEFEQ